MTRQKPALHASQIFADFDEAVAIRTKELEELALEKRNARIQWYRDAVRKIEAANEGALAGRSQELAFGGQKTPGQAYPFQNTTERTQEVKDARATFMEAQRNGQAYSEPRSLAQPTLPTPSPFSDTPTDFELVLAAYDDIPALVQVHIDAYKYDPLTQLMRRGTDPEEYKRRLTDLVRRTWGQSSVDTWILVAKRKTDGEALGCAVYRFYDKADEEEVLEESEKDGEQTKEDLIEMLRWGGAGAETESERMTGDGYDFRSKDETPAPPKGKSLQEVARAGMIAMHERWVPAKTRYMYLASLAVSSQHQSHGVGGALLHAGMSRADAEGLLIWLEATPAGHPVYEHYGWKTVDSSSVRLQDFAGPAGEQSGWGVYKASGCLRLPQLVPKDKEKEKNKEKDTRWESKGMEEESKKREDEKWWTEEYHRISRERKMRKEKEQERRNALRESGRNEEKIEASRRFSEKRNEKRMDREKEIQKEEAKEESDSWRSFRERMDEKRSEREGAPARKLRSTTGNDEASMTLSDWDNKLWGELRGGKGEMTEYDEASMAEHEDFKWMTMAERDNKLWGERRVVGKGE